MDAEDLTRLRCLCSRDPKDMQPDDLDDLQTYARLCLSELQALRGLLRDVNAELKRATLEAPEKL